MPITIEQYIEGLELSPEEKTIVTKALGSEKNLRELEGRGLRQSEFSRLADEAKVKVDAATAEQKKAADYYATVNQWRMTKESEFNTTVEERIKAIRPQLISSGLTEEEADKILGGTAVAIKRGEPNPSGNGNSEFLSKKEAMELAKGAAFIPGLYLKIEREHKKLFGADAEVDYEALAKKSFESGESLVGTWEKEFKVSEKRVELAKVQHDKEMKEAEERGKKVAMDEFYQKNPDLLNRVTNSSLPTGVLQDIAKRNLEAHPDLKGSEAGGDAARLKRVTDAVAKWPQVLAEANGQK